ncbi:MAG TPA: DUF6798 domain-containing protein [Pirellulales bacterium]
MTPSPLAESPGPREPGVGRHVYLSGATLDAALVLLVFFIHGAWPVPDVNETCYLLKAKHYWNPAWLAHDQFLSSADAHWFFYLACGWPTLFLSLEASAWVLRFLGWAFLALGWTALSRTIAPRTGLAALSAVGFLGLVEHAHMAGEWIAGGVEGKVFSYACILFALANVARGRWNRALLWLAPATLFHVLVGGWASIAIGGAWLLVGRGQPAPLGSSRDASLRGMASGLIVWAIYATLAVVPALQLSSGIDPAVERTAHEITLARRLPHHLDFARFDDWFRFRHALLWAAWGGLIVAIAATNHFGRAKRESTSGSLDRPRPIETRRLMRVQGAVAGAAMLALVGIAIATWFPRPDEAPPTLLRFYWFRLADVFAPLGVSLSAVTLLLRRGRLGWLGTALWLACVLACGADLVNAAWTRAAIPAPRAFKTDPANDVPDVEEFRRFKDACAWVARKTPEDSLFIISRDADAFKWYAGRADLVNWKDFPQDAPSIMEWWSRLLDVGMWDAVNKRYRHRVGLNKGTLPPMSGEELKRVSDKYGARYLFVRGRRDLPFEILYAQESEAGYLVYDLQTPKTQDESPAPRP